MPDDIQKSVDDLVAQTLADAGVVEPVVVVTPAEVIIKSEDEDKDKKKDGEEDKDSKDKKDEKKKPDFMKKSMEELASILSEDELQVIAAWREEMGEAEAIVEETIVKSQTDQASDLVKSMIDKHNADMDELKKSFAAKDDMIKSLSEQVAKLAAQPAHEPKAISDLTVIEKSNEQPTLTRAQIIDKMYELQKSGTDVNSLHITEFENKGRITNQHVRQLVANACMKS